MNANELADELESRMPAGYWTPPELLAEAAIMLRQQQAEIESLKSGEPVAWIAYDEFGDFMLEATPEGDYPWQPLYTHPAKTITASDWISVEDSLPDYFPNCDFSSNVFTTNGKQVFVMARYYDHDAAGWMWANCHGNIFGDAELDDDYSDITHWMPFPKAPKTK